MDILVVDDDKETIEALNQLLTSLGYNVVLCQDGPGAWEVLQKNDSPNLILLNQVIPGMGGIELCQKIRELEREIYSYIILLGSKTSKENFIDGMEAGADDYITKPFDPQELRLRLRAGMRIIELNHELVESQKSLQNIVTLDLLTGILNRKTILAVLESEAERSFREEKNFCLANLDLDGFKQVNETYGHKTGDQILKEVVKSLQTNLRRYDSIGRYGEDGFLIIQPGCDLGAAQICAERLRACISDNPIYSPNGPVSITVSIGVRVHGLDKKADSESLIGFSENSLAKAKSDGGNRVVVAVDL